MLELGIARSTLCRDDVLHHAVHDIGRLLVHGGIGVAVVLVDELMVALLETGDDVRLVHGTAVAIGDVGVDQVLHGDAIGQSADGQRRERHIRVALRVDLAEVEAEVLGREVEHGLRRQVIDQVGGDGVEGLHQTVVHVEVVAGVVQ